MFRRYIQAVLLAGVGLGLSGGCQGTSMGWGNNDRSGDQAMAAGDRQQSQLVQSIRSWPAASQKAAEQMEQKYGQPTARTSSMLLWENKSPWKRIIVYREAINHDFPIPHQDVLEQTIAYDVPADKLDELAQFDGSITASRTNGTLSARCEKEAANFLALNLANDIIKNGKTVEQARQEYADAVRRSMLDQPVAAMQNLQFRPPEQAGFTDVATILDEQPNQARPAAGQQPPQQQQPRQAQ